MRTRFHSVDFFDYPTSTGSFFHHLPLPPQNAPPPDPEFFPSESLRRSLHVEIPLTDLAIPTMPDHTALSRFYSDVLPQFIDQPSTSLLTDQASAAGENMVPQKYETEKTKSYVENKTILNFDHDKNETNIEVVQFEAPQPDTLMVNDNIIEEMVHVLPEISEMGVKMDETECELQMPYLPEKSVYSVDRIQSDYYPDEETCASQRDENLQNIFHQFPFPHFEVDMILGISFKSVTGNELVSLFCCMEHEYKNQGDTFLSDVKDLLPSTGASLVETIQCLELENFEMEGTDLALEKDFICMKESQFLEEQVECSVEKLVRYYCVSSGPVFFQEVQFLEIDTSPTIDFFLDYSKAQTLLNLCSIVKENLSLLTFDELIVSNELVLADDMFISVPVPIISDCETIASICNIAWKALAESKSQPISVSNDIYLDWHLLEDHIFGNDTNVFCEKLLEDLNICHIELDLVSCDIDLSILYVTSEDTEIDSSNKECKLSFSCNIPEVDVGMGLSRMPVPSNGGLINSKTTDMQAILSKTAPQFNALEFFLNPQEAAFGKKRVSGVRQLGPIVSSHTDNSNYRILHDTIPVNRFRHLDLRIHPVTLSDNILTLINYFQKYYLAIIESISLPQTTYTSFPFGDKSKLLRLSKQELVNEIGPLILQSASGRDENILALLTLCAIKQISWYLCFYGIHATHSYIHNLCSALDFLRLRLCLLESMISDALSQTEKDITRSHPSLAKISEILSSKPSEGESKILIVVEQALWCPLKILLSSIGLSFKEIQNYQSPSCHQDLGGASDSSTVVTDILLNADCLIGSHKSVSGNFAFHKFALIVEYGGSHGSSRISCERQTSAGLPPLNFLKMELQHLDALKVFCENSELPFSLGATLEGQATLLFQNHGNINLQKLEQVLNCVPDSDKPSLLPSKAKIAEACAVSSSTSSEEKSAHNCTTPLQSPHLQQKIISQPGLSSYPERLIVMNTQNLNKEMIVTRRSTYQRLLALEKEGVQVMERDSSLPADIIMTASLCLVWYESRNLLNTVNREEASSCLSFCIEHIATNVLMQLSLAFSGCYLVFEGSHSFTSSITEYTDGLYAAAASLGLDIQLFYSHSPESTGDIILNCIRSATRSDKNIYPTMPESETLAECFLTEFPSINPLSAHAILCSGISLNEFFQMSHMVRLQALNKYHVPEVSLSLLGVLCKFGEREDTRSGTTDCSSSVSSAPESKYFHCKLDMGGKKRKFSRTPPKERVALDKSLQYEHINTPFDGSLNPPFVAAQFVSRRSVGSNESTDFSKASFCFDDMSYGSQGEGVFIPGDEICEDKDKPACTTASVGEEDFNGNFYLGDNYFPFEKSRIPSPFYGKRKAPEPKNPRIARRLSFEAISDPTYSTASMGNFDRRRENNTRGYDHEAGTETNDIYYYTDLGYHGTPSKAVHDDLEGRGEPNSKRLHAPGDQDADITFYGCTPLRNAIGSFKQKKGSPWTIEFLNKVREKSMANQKSQSCGTCPSFLGQKGNKHHTTKRKSPSIIDFFRYQGGHSAKKTLARKTWLPEKELSGSMESQDASASRTPLDKRSRKALSFTMSKHGSQSKLVWLDS